MRSGTGWSVQWLRVGRTLLVLSLGMATVTATRAGADEPAARPSAPGAVATIPVSFHKQIRPLVQAHCQGCHQPAKLGGGYAMTDFAHLMQPGESGDAPVVAGQPEASNLVAQITPGKDGTAAMPPKGPALSPSEVDLVARWVREGARDDSPPAATSSRFDRDHPPTYTRPPVITALDFSPDGTTLAVGGFHEVVLWDAAGTNQLGRLVGLSERIESVRFSPDGRKLAVVGGLPCRMGEVQVWDVAERKLLQSVAVTGDTLYGVSWSPDGTRIAFGGGDNSVRAIDAATGAQVLFMGSHADWVLDTAFIGNDHLVSVGRDMAAKLTEVATQRFVDNVTSITPGALKGGLAAITKHPLRDEFLVGGADGVPKIYRVFRETERKIGDDANLIAALNALPGRIFGVATSHDGRRFAAASSLDHAGRVDIYDDRFDPATAPEAIRTTLARPGKERTAEQRAALDKYRQEQIKRVASVPVTGSGVYALAVRPDGGTVAAAGTDGIVRLLNGPDGAEVAAFVPVPLVKGAAGPDAVAQLPAPAGIASEVDRSTGATAQATEPPILGAITALRVEPPVIHLPNLASRVQLVVTATTSAGDLVDATRLVQIAGADLVRVSRSGVVAPVEDGEGTLRVSLGDRTVAVPFRSAGRHQPIRCDFAQDVAPVLSKLGCNAGTCHGSAQGKNGFKLSLRGYDPIFDVRALTDDHGSRRVNLASPDDSLMLLKTSGGVPHVGGVLMRTSEPSYAILRAWIAGGARLDATAKVASIAVFPINPVVQAVGARQQLRVVATYTDGTTRDVSGEAFTESGNIEVATADKTGLMTALRRGEAPVLVRYEGAYAATTLTVMGDRAGFVEAPFPAQNKIDELVAAKWRRLKTEPSATCTDAEFLRRASLDLTGLPPTADEVRAFLADSTESVAKRAALVDRLIGSPAFVDYWTNKWADLLLVNRKFLGAEGAVGFRDWIRGQVAANTPHDQFVRSILTARGSNRTNPASSYYKILREPTAIMENTTQLFLGVRFNCNKCHDHPFERWTQDQYYELSAAFARVGLKGDAESKGRNIGGSAVEAAQPLFEEVYDQTTGEVTHDRTKKTAPTRFPFLCEGSPATPDPSADRREALANWLTSKHNPYFARSHVNRLWGYLFGVGIIEPIDDIRAGNPATNPELLDYLTDEFVRTNFDTRHVLRLIAQSRVYGLSVVATRYNNDDKTNFTHAMARRLPAEVLLDAVYRVTGSTSKFPGVPVGTRAAALPDSGVELPSGFLGTFGRPVRESACECERSSGLQLGPVMALVSGPTLGEALADPTNDLGKLVAAQADDGKLIEELFLRILNRPATPDEVATCLDDLRSIVADGTTLAEAVARRAAEVDAARPALEQKRVDGIAAATRAQEEFERANADRFAAEAKAHEAAIAQADADLKAYQATEPERLASWIRAQNPINRWRTLPPQVVQDTSKAEFAVRPDGSVIASGPNANGTLTFTAETDLPRLTGLRLEMLLEPGLPNQGPGRAPDGNFVINEIKATVAPKGKPGEARAVALENPLSDFNQAGFDIRYTVDGSPAGDKGWAVAGGYGRQHWATFDLIDPPSFPEGTVLTLSVMHNYPGNVYMPGHFRVAAAGSPSPVGLSLPDELQTAVTTAPEVWTLAQRTAVLNHLRGTDAALAGKTAALAAAQKPLPVDPARQSLTDRLAEANLPIPPDGRLAQLKTDEAMSRQQAEAKRLTAAQDITWALINSPSFLFNH